MPAVKSNLFQRLFFQYFPTNSSNCLWENLEKIAICITDIHNWSDGEQKWVMSTTGGTTNSFVVNATDTILAVYGKPEFHSLAINYFSGNTNSVQPGLGF
jgi:hypothetical protein